MKARILAVMAAVGAMAFTACQSDPGVITKGRDAGFTFTLDVEGHNSDIGTRATSVPSVGSEDVVDNLYLLFFNYTELGTGAYVTSTRIEGPLEMQSKIQVNYSALGLDSQSPYTVLAVANLADDTYIQGPVAEWISGFDGLNERQAFDFARARVDGSGSDDIDDNSAGDVFNRLFMSARMVIMPGETSGDLLLTRGMVRFDVSNYTKEKFDMVSVSIWNGVRNTAVWPYEFRCVSDRIERFYGVMPATDGQGYREDIEGGLYAFENFTLSPYLDDNRTTCLIVGLEPRDDAGVDWTGVSYYRVNVDAMSGTSQNLKRNYVYKLNIRNVYEKGAVTERDAWTSNKTSLEYDMNRWNLDENGLTQTDDQNTLIVPVRNVKIAADGGKFEYSILTLGPGQLRLSKNQFDEGITAALNGNLLTVEATSMAAAEAIRKGVVELTLNKLRATIDFSQSESDEKYLILNRATVPAFESVLNDMIKDGFLSVSSSGKWRARIYNNTASTNNPGFSFTTTTYEGTPQLEINQSTTVGDVFQVYTTGPNESYASRYAVLYVWLEDDESFNQSIILRQKPSGGLRLYPTLENNVMRFTAWGYSPEGDAPETGITYFVDSGEKENAEGVYNNWKMVISGADADHFEIVNNMAADPEKKNSSFFIRALGSDETDPSSRANHSNRELTFTINISMDDPDVTDVPPAIVVTVVQSPFPLSLSTSGSSVVSKRGGTINPIRVNTDAGLTYSAYIDSDGSPFEGLHEAAIYVDGQPVDQLTGISPTQTITVGFPKLLTPYTFATPTATLVVTVDGTELVARYPFSQEMLTPSVIRILSGNTGYVSIETDNFSQMWRSFAFNTSFYGPGTGAYVRTASPAPSIGQYNYYGTTGTAVPAGINYAHLNRADQMSTAQDAYIAAYRTRVANEKQLVVYAPDENNTVQFNSGRVLNTLGYVAGGTGHSTNRQINPASDVMNSPVMKYLLEDGPFTTGGRAIPSAGALALQFYTDGINTSVSISGSAVVQDRKAVPILIHPTRTDEAILVIDPVNNLVYNGEGQMYWTQSGYAVTAASATATGTTAEIYRSRFFGNLLAYIYNAAQYGSHFTDNFIDENGYAY